MVGSLPRHTLPLVALLLFTGCADDGASNGSDGPEPEDNFSEPREDQDLPGGQDPVGVNPCDDGDITCHWQLVGKGSDRPFSGEKLRGESNIDDGALSAKPSTEEFPVVWISNHGSHTLSRVDPVSFVEQGRYRTGPASEDHGPSAVATADDGSVFAINRHSQKVVHVGLSPFCPIQSGETELRTSSGRDDIKDFGSDDCLLWHADLSGHGDLNAIALESRGENKEALWVTSENGSLWKLDPQNGNDLFRTEMPIAPTAMELDPDGRLWMIEDGSDLIAMVDTTLCTDHSSCDVEPCDGFEEQCVKSTDDIPTSPRDLTLDDEGRVWLSGDLAVFDPRSPIGDRWQEYGRPHSQPIYGLVSDGSQWLYGAADSDGVYRIDLNDPSRQIDISATSGRSIRHIHKDTQGLIWALDPDGNDATIIEPGPGPYDATVIERIGGFNRPQTSGSIAALHVDIGGDQSAVLRSVLQGCSPDNFHHNEWQTLRFDADIPEGTLIEWRVRGASHEANLGQASWLYAGQFENEPRPIDLRALLSEHDASLSRFIEVEGRLYPGVVDGVTSTPRLEVFDTVSFCPTITL